jgi:hypothetical protein
VTNCGRLLSASNCRNWQQQAEQRSLACIMAEICFVKRH